MYVSLVLFVRWHHPAMRSDVTAANVDSNRGDDVVIWIFIPIRSLRCNRGSVSVICPSWFLSRVEYFFRYARTLNGFRRNLREAITTTNRSNDYIWTKINRNGTTEQIKQKNRIDLNRCCRDVKQVLTPSEWIHKFQSTDAIVDIIVRYLKDFIYKFEMQLLQILKQFYFYSKTIYYYTIFFNSRRRHHNSFIRSLRASAAWFACMTEWLVYSVTGLGSRGRTVVGSNPGVARSDRQWWNL